VHLERQVDVWTNGRRLVGELGGDAPTPGVGGTIMALVCRILVPCRNAAPYVGRLLDSIVVNEYPRDRLELLIVGPLPR
jgi:hypothetical protein